MFQVEIKLHFSGIKEITPLNQQPTNQQTFRASLTGTQIPFLSDSVSWELGTLLIAAAQQLLQVACCCTVSTCIMKFSYYKGNPGPCLQIPLIRQKSLRLGQAEKAHVPAGSGCPPSCPSFTSQTAIAIRSTPAQKPWEVQATKTCDVQGYNCKQALQAYKEEDSNEVVVVKGIATY